jgi:glutamyl-tRNA reductase
MQLQQLTFIAFTHRNFDVSDIGCLHITEDQQHDQLTAIKEQFNLDELMFLSTCNRVEFACCGTSEIDRTSLYHVLLQNYPSISKAKLELLVKGAEFYNGLEGVDHLLRLTSSIDSMIIGEREIITQVRNAYENSKKMNLSGDFLRILMRQTIETAKKVYTNTAIATRPVSVVSLAYLSLKDLNVSIDARILIVGSGATNTNMGRFLKKHGFKKFTVFNRTLSKAESLAKDLKGIAKPLTDLETYMGGFDVIITCTGSDQAVITLPIYEQLLGVDNDKKIIIDLSIPHDLSPEIVVKHKVNHISVDYLQKISKENQNARAQELEHVETIIAQGIIEFEALHKERKIELAMRSVPMKVKEITATMQGVFAEDISKLDDNAKATLEKVLAFMEKKYMSIPMVMAKEILIKN